MPLVESRSWNQGSSARHTCLTEVKKRLCRTLYSNTGQPKMTFCNCQYCRIGHHHVLASLLLHQSFFYLCTDSLATKFKNILKSSKLW